MEGSHFSFVCLFVKKSVVLFWNRFMLPLLMFRLVFFISFRQVRCQEFGILVEFQQHRGVVIPCCAFEKVWLTRPPFCTHCVGDRLSVNMCVYNFRSLGFVVKHVYFDL